MDLQILELAVMTVDKTCNSMGNWGSNYVFENAILGTGSGVRSSSPGGGQFCHVTIGGGSGKGEMYVRLR